MTRAMRVPIKITLEEWVNPIRGSIFRLRARGPGDSRIVPVTVGYSWEPGAESRTPSNTSSNGMSLSSKFTNSSSKQVMESYYSCNQGYAPWDPTPYQPHDLGYDAYQSYGFGDAYYGYEDPSPPYPPSQKGIEEWKTQSAINNPSSTSQPLNSEDRPSKSLPNPRGCIPTLKKDSRLSQPLSNQWRSIPTLFRCVNQKEGEDALLHEEDDESLTQEGMHECLEEVEEENKYQEAEDVDQDVEHKDKEQKGVESVHFASSEATPPMLPSELHFKWLNPYDMSCLGPLRYGLIETDGQLKALCGVLDKKKMDSMELSESKFKGCNGLLHKLHNNKAKIGWANRVWDLRKSSTDHHWEVTHCMGALRSLNHLGHTNFKHWWGFKDEFKHKLP
ncbi:hypothetical protein PIB30_022155 [Stylosanthes scabra]|uniref:Uncharacterized protein n=1 Tax=Stylosanthes scabra TaxID=79078 RepID=A0ABU6VAM1_9FABA|nr:hypothetical protein [Stylosanthes scabra]